MAVVRVLLIGLLATFAVSWSGSSAANGVEGASTTIVAQSTSTSSSPYCRSDPHAGVHDPDRLEIISPCAELVGVVARAPKLNPGDGDVTLNVLPDTGFESMMNSKNRSEGGLHVEIVPMDQPGCTAAQLSRLSVNNLGTCSGADVIYPPLGTRVRVIGPFVFDRWVGWNEIHPAWHIDIIPPSGPPPPEQHSFKAVLSGVTLRKGAAKGKGSAAITVGPSKLCWTFSGIRNIGTATRADIATRPSSPGALRLGPRFTRGGCVTPPHAVLEQVVQHPRTFFVTVYSVRYPRGAIRGRVTPTSD